MSEPRKFPAKILKVIDEKTIVIDRGMEDGVKDGDVFLVYALGEEIIDPDTKENYGKLEIVKGRAIVEHTQERIATLKSSKTVLPDKKVIYRKPIGKTFGLLSALGGAMETKEEVHGEEEILPFENVKIGDLVKPI
jgi:hypothetical protein